MLFHRGPETFGGLNCIVDVSVNVLRKDGPTWQFSTCCDSGVSTGLCSLSTATEGLILFADKEASLKTAVCNDAGACVPFATPRIKGPRALVMRAAEERHPDAAFIEERFSWTEKQLGQKQKVVPPSLFGSHAPESYLASWARELGLAGLQPLRPGGLIGVLPALHQQLKGSLASFGWLHPMAVGPALVQRGLAPALHCS